MTPTSVTTLSHKGMPNRIGKYRVLRQIGKGASSTVYLAFDEFLDREVAIKVYGTSLPGPMPARLRSQFLNEASLVGRLSHPHIAAIIDADADEELSYLVCEYVAGGSLLNLIQAGARPEISDVIEIGFKCCGALDYAHRNNIIHRDLKPANILFAGGTNIKISDFGIAYIDDAETTQLLNAGSPGYASPEQLQEQKLTCQSDMFSLAVVLYELATGRRPFTGSTAADTVYEILNKAPVPPSVLCPDLPRDLDEVLLRGLRKEPGDRFATWAEFALALAEVGRLSEYDKTLTDDDKFATLRSHPQLAMLDDHDIGKLARVGRWSHVPAHTVVVREQELGDSIFLLIEGEAKVTIAGRLLNVVRVGEWFGETPFILGHAGERNATVETTVDSTLIGFPIDVIEILGAKRQLHIARSIMRNLSDRLSFSNLRVSASDTASPGEAQDDS